MHPENSPVACKLESFFLSPLKIDLRKNIVTSTPAIHNQKNLSTIKKSILKLSPVAKVPSDLENSLKHLSLNPIESPGVPLPILAMNEIRVTRNRPRKKVLLQKLNASYRNSLSKMNWDSVLNNLENFEDLRIPATPGKKWRSSLQKSLASQSTKSPHNVSKLVIHLIVYVSFMPFCISGIDGYFRVFQ